MDNLPPELLRTILLASVRLCRSDKNALLPLRLVNKRFDFILREYIFKTIQLDFSRFTRGSAAPQMASLTGVGQVCKALYCDMMVIRDEEEITRLFQVFNSIIGKVPEMTTLLDSLRQYCMSETTFDESDFRRVMEGALQATPKMSRLKLNLPFQVIGRASRTATLLLATTFACFANRPEGYAPLETFVIDHVSDSTILDICQNPIDIGNALATFRSLKNLVISIKRQESGASLMSMFAARLWFLISEAKHLESLCITGWNVKTAGPARRRRARVDFNDWMMKSLPYYDMESARVLRNLRFLELKRIDIDPIALKRLIEQHSTSLKELYLNEVYLKVFESPDRNATALWIGHGNSVEKSPRCCWLAEDLRKMEHLDLKVLRVSGLGYNDFDPTREMQIEQYDFVDPLGLSRTFEQRFVEAVLDNVSDPDCPEVTGSEQLSMVPDTEKIGKPIASSPTIYCSSGPGQAPTVPDSIISAALNTTNSSKGRRPKVEYDVAAFQRLHNTTSHWKCSIDGLFFNHNEKALIELQKIISVADRGMTLLSDEIDRLHALTRMTEDGNGGDGT